MSSVGMALSLRIYMAVYPLKGFFGNLDRYLLMIINWLYTNGYPGSCVGSLFGLSLIHI
mgnify:CR=1 FL=1